MTSSSWTFKGQPGEIGRLILNLPDSDLNLLSTNVFQELQERLKEIQKVTLKGLLVVSGKPDNFVAGANINELAEMTTVEQGVAASRQAQTIFNVLTDLPFPTLAVLHGPCLGGGMELALACTFRVATDDPKTSLAQPEVQLGILPGAGGTVRLPRLIGLPAALPLMLTGKRLTASQAHRVGLVDAVIPAYEAERWGRWWLEKFLTGTRPATRPSSLKLFLVNGFLGRALIATMAKRQTLTQTKGHYPAPLKIIEVAQRALGRSLTSAFELEAKGFGTLVETPHCKSLIHLFFSVTGAKKDWGDVSKATPHPVHHIGVIGGGLMGSGIASVLIEKGFLVRLRDVNLDAVGRARKTIYGHLASRAKRQKKKGASLLTRMNRLTTSTDAGGYRLHDVLIEAVFEDLQIKRQVLKEFEDHASSQSIFATNTSTIPIADIAAQAKHPDRVVGMHFFSPVPKMPLVEVITGKQTDPSVVVTVVDLARAMGKNVIVVNDAPGFYVNRPLGLYIMEALKVLCEGASVESIDDAMRAFGFPVGPLQVLDEVGWDIGYHVNSILTNSYGERFKSPIDFKPLIQAKRVGRKSGKGFYLYEGSPKGERLVDPTVYALLPTRSPRTIEPGVIQQRLVNVFMEEAQRCLDEGIIRSERDGDIGAVFGCGFPPFLGGPFWYKRNIKPK